MSAECINVRLQADVVIWGVNNPIIIEQYHPSRDCIYCTVYI